jgi:hypothetical protein
VKEGRRVSRNSYRERREAVIDPTEIRVKARKLSEAAGMNEDLQVFGLVAYLSLRMSWDIEKVTDAIEKFLAEATLPTSVGLDFLAFLAARVGSLEEFESFYAPYAESFRAAMASPEPIPPKTTPVPATTVPVRVVIEAPAEEYDAAGALIVLRQPVGTRTLGNVIFRWMGPRDAVLRFAADVYNSDAGPQLSVYALGEGKGCLASAPPSRDLTAAVILKTGGVLYEVCVVRKV